MLEGKLGYMRKDISYPNFHGSIFLLYFQKVYCTSKSFYIM